jgi:hypothetical protein
LKELNSNLPEELTKTLEELEELKKGNLKELNSKLQNQNYHDIKEIKFYK